MTDNMQTNNSFIKIIRKPQSEAIKPKAKANKPKRIISKKE